MSDPRVRWRLGGRELPAALFAALVVTQALADGRHWAVGADTVGVGPSRLPSPPANVNGGH